MFALLVFILAIAWEKRPARKLHFQTSDYIYMYAFQGNFKKKPVIAVLFCVLSAFQFSFCFIISTIVIINIFVLLWTVPTKWQTCWKNDSITA